MHVALRDKFALVIPTLNEAGNVETLLNKIREVLEPLDASYEIIVVDDGSTDGTPEIVQKYAESDRRIRLLSRHGERGLAGAVIHGWNHSDAELLGVIDADLQHPPELLPDLIREMALAGCTGVFIGFESLSDDNLAAAGKKTPKTADYARRVRMFHDSGIQVNGSFVLGFDCDRKDVFTRTAEWIEENRLECATFHTLTPYPATPLFRQMESEQRLLHRDWSLYDTAHAVFRPKHMTPEELEQGYAWVYSRLFSRASIWRRRPEDWRAVLPYLGMSYLYKRSNRLWHQLIKHDLVHAVWSPLVETCPFGKAA